MRNVAGLTGLALLGAALGGEAGAWAPPLGYGIYAVLASPASGWNWPGQPAGAGAAAVIAVLLLGLGFAAILPAGVRGPAGERR